MSLVAVNCYAERLEGDVVIWLVFSQIDGQVFAMTFEPEQVPPLVRVLSESYEKAKLLAPADPLCAVCGERPGKPIYGGKCVGCFEAQRAERDEW